MRKIYTLSIFSLVIILLIFAISKLFNTDAHYKQVEISGNIVKAEAADTTAKRMEGLMFKKTLPQNQGMIFIFDKEGHPGIWMMGMSFPIDIIWINKDFEIVDIAENAKPCIISCPVHVPEKKSVYVLEVNSGFVKENNISVGDVVRIS